MVASSPAGATPSKPFSFVVCTPDETCGPSVSAVTGLGAASTTLTATLTNENKVGTGLNDGSANLTPPAGFVINGALGHLTLSGCTGGIGGCTATLDAAGIIELRSLGQTPGSPPITLTMTGVGVPASGCTVASPCTWGIEVKQSNDFSGAPGNDLTLDSGKSSLTTELGMLQFGTQPQDAQVNQPITGVAGNPSGQPPVTVQVVDSATPAAVTSYDGGPVTLALENNPTSATLGGTTAAEAVSGAASFVPGPTVNLTGYGYTLLATAPDSLPSTTSSAFNVFQFASGKQCNGNCSTGINDSANKQQLNASSLSGTNGQLFVALGPTSGFWSANAAACPNYTFISPDEDTINLTTTTTGKLVQDIVTIPVASGAAIKTIAAGQQLCFAAPYHFIGQSGPAIPSVGNYPGTNSPGFVALLADCAVQPNQPCVSNRIGTKVKGSSNPLLGTFEIDVTIPAGLSGDPFTHH
jgi:hypothetical protein